jgi:hypothetical protein
MKDELIKLDLILDKLTEQEQEYALENQLPYFFSKANLFLKIGYEKYRLGDYYKQPPADATNKELELLKSGCQQVIEGKGLFSNNPFVNLDVSGFSSLLRLFHFKEESRKTKHKVEFDSKRGALDCITFVHVISKQKTTLFNFCEY